MGEYDYGTRKAITDERKKNLHKRIRKYAKADQTFIEEDYYSYSLDKKQLAPIIREYENDPGKKPSEWFLQPGPKPGAGLHQGLLDAFVPQGCQASYLYIIDKLNQFPFSYGWNRRTVRTKGYGPQMHKVFHLLNVYERLFYCGEHLEDFILGRLDEEKRDYIHHEWSFSQDFSLLYAAEIDRGNQAVIHALKSLIESENNTAYLDREMILGIFRSDNRELHRLVCGLLVAARLQEGVRQVICETMDEGVKDAFLAVCDVIEANDLIRFSSVKRAVSTWIGIFDENSVDRVNTKLLTFMSRCLRDSGFCRSQLQTNDSIAISAALWALGFEEAQTAVDAMMELVDRGTKNQKLTASFYNESLFDAAWKMQAARKVILEYTDDLELVAAFMPAFSSCRMAELQQLLYWKNGSRSEIIQPKEAVLTDYFADREEAEREYDTFLHIYKSLPKKGVVYDPCIFPWYRVELKPSEVICVLGFAAYVLQDEEKMTQAAGLLGEITVSGYNSSRAGLVRLLLYHPANRAQRGLLIQYMGNAEEATSSTAAALVKMLDLQEQDYRLMEDMLRFKRSTLRRDLLQLLMGQEDAGMEQCITRLLADKKEEKRIAGLDLLMRLSKDKKKAAFYTRLKPLAAAMEKPTDKEKVMLEEILGEGASPATAQKGFGIYDPQAPVHIPQWEEGRGRIRQCLPLPEKEVIAKIKKLDALIHQYRDLSYDAVSGEKELLGNNYIHLAAADAKQGYMGNYRLKNYPLEEQLRAYFETEIGDYGTFVEWEARLLVRNNEVYRNSQVYYETLFGKIPFAPEPLQLRYEGQIQQIRLNYRYEFLDRKFLLEAGIQAAQALLPVLNEDSKTVTYHYESWNGSKTAAYVSVRELRFLDRLLEGLALWETDEEFQRAFYTAWQLELKCNPEKEQSRFQPGSRGMQVKSVTPIAPYWFLKAYELRLITKDNLFQAMLSYFKRKEILEALCQLVQGEFTKLGSRSLWRMFFGERRGEEVFEHGEELAGKQTWCGRLAQELYDAIVPVMVDTELRRGEAETVFSADITGITYICGVQYLVRILKALGKDTLGRNAYYSWYGSSNVTKKEVLSHLLKYCYPAKEDTAAALAAALAGTDIKEQRLVEAAMYAPQWIGLIGEYLGWSGLQSGCYYFMAHMNERFDDQKMAMIARYTPLSAEELQDGAFDIGWFREAYGLLGEKNFAMLYQAAKYLSDGQKHSRARKYADAATGKVTLEDLQEQIRAKRNKDLLMSYGLVPFAKKKDQDLLQRYQFIQNFAKEARQFGAQRRASETQAAQTALVNLSVHAGFADVTRLTLNMESRMAEQFTPLMAWTPADDVEVCLHVDELGKSEVLCRKGEKMLKSVPARLKKHPYVLEVKDAQKKLKEQYSRTKKLMEESMEDGARFTAAEAAGLMGNPVVRAILQTLVFIHEKDTGFIIIEDAGSSAVSVTNGSTASMAAGSIAAVENAGSTDGKRGRKKRSGKKGAHIFLRAWDGSVTELDPRQEIRIAHPLDFYKLGIWHEYQKYLFDRQIRQPFKQVFRELYVKLSEELEQKSSRMFAGNQIQPQKTVACLKGRRWVADYEEGLQKVYYKENIIARIYALADWFSPSDIEAPTLEWVEFSDRKTFQPLAIAQVPDLIYSEVMRDVDLAVSVAHAGGVDPQTSHSTMEMRRAIVEFNLPLFGLTNVTLQDGHALIHGKRAKYNVHLGSGVVHQEGGAMLHILPVHSQKRGKLFLPFVDEDPKTAEIMSKIVLLAEDTKIRDPFILDQIDGTAPGN